MKTAHQDHLSLLLSNTMELRFSESQKEKKKKDVIRVTEIRTEKIKGEACSSCSLRARFSMGLLIVSAVFNGSFHFHQYKPTFQKQIGYLHEQAGS